MLQRRLTMLFDLIVHKMRKRKKIKFFFVKKIAALNLKFFLSSDKNTNETFRAQMIPVINESKKQTRHTTKSDEKNKHHRRHKLNVYIFSLKKLNKTVKISSLKKWTESIDLQFRRKKIIGPAVIENNQQVERKQYGPS